jgi:hypothetical protein
MIDRFSRVLTSIAVAGAILGLVTACGGNNDSVPSATLKVVPALGAVYGAPVSVYNGTTGLLLGSGTTGLTSGTVDIPLFGSTSGPIVVKVTLSEGVKYFDEKLNRDETITSATATSLLTALNALPTSDTKSVGVTPLTNMAAKLAGLDPSGSTFTVTPEKALEGLARTVLALGLPADFNITGAPEAAKSLTSLPTDVYGLMLAEMAKRAATTALQQSNDLAASASTNGTVTGSEKLTAVTAALSTAVTVANTGFVLAQPNLVPDTAALGSAVSSQQSTVSSGNAPSGASGASGASGSLSQ